MKKQMQENDLCEISVVKSPTLHDARITTMPIEFKDGKTHRDPSFPVGGYAPGSYMAVCLSCGGTFMNMDKLATECFPCAVEELQTMAKTESYKSAKIRQIRNAARKILDATNE